jgi:hypothetical protein
MDDLIPIEAEPPKPAPVVARRRDPNFSRSNVVNDVQRAFDLIGGVDRLTLWANQNPGKFYTQVYTKLLPSTSLNIVGDNTKVVIEHAIPETPLDNHE